jgi:hypothetical protein
MRYEACWQVPPQGPVRSWMGPSGASSRFLVEYPLERYELYAHTLAVGIELLVPCVLHLEHRANEKILTSIVRYGFNIF